MSGDDTPVRVEIFGEEYTIRSEMDPEYTRACARVVDEAIQEAHVGSHVSEPHRAAILAALEITDRLYRAEAERDELRDELSERLARLRHEVESALDD